MEQPLMLLLLQSYTTHVMRHALCSAEKLGKVVATSSALPGFFLYFPYFFLVQLCAGSILYGVCQQASHPRMLLYLSQWHQILKFTSHFRYTQSCTSYNKQGAGV
jgi:hypothetical protein